MKAQLQSSAQSSLAEISFIITAQPPTHPGIVVLKHEIVQIQKTLINNMSHTTQIK